MSYISNLDPIQSFRKTIFSCLLYICHWTPTGTSTAWHKLNSPFWNHLCPNTLSVCTYHLFRDTTRNLSAILNRVLCPTLHFQSPNSHPFCLLNICQIHSLPFLYTAIISKPHYTSFNSSSIYIFADDLFYNWGIFTNYNPHTYRRFMPLHVGILRLAGVPS